ncbi:hypothetical protein MPSEU_000514200 [Mayamaea pseudoterrestris]|nr:hypothetical protein MPSEU_000514200 [Mayamaea pseudoterrestris]
MTRETKPRALSFGSTRAFHPNLKKNDSRHDFQTRSRIPAALFQSDGLWNATVFSLPRFLQSSCKTFLGVTVALYILNQKALLPQPLSAVVSRALFWPTLPITAVRRLWVGSWTTVIDETVIIGGAPFGFLKWPERLRHDYGVSGIVNMCEEYNGPIQRYDALGCDYLHLPTVDHFIPTVEHLELAVDFIQKHRDQGEKVYVHCRAGHGRSAAAVFAWMLYKDPMVDRKELNRRFCKLRNVKSTLWKQPNIIEFHRRILDGEYVCKYD